ncbi:uncharacterized protein [Eucyclogobius newberryi]|uniref:uncharacterized protein n=1 Tax=Eucyclogobius newberryi TaxID=166745 RepID=UPI003B59DFB9
MAESVRSPFDYREPPTLDSDGDGSKPPPQGRVCGRKRKGTPVKVCDRVYVTEDEEESMSEHSYSPGEGQYPDGAEDHLAPPGSPYYLPDSAQFCVPELGEDGGAGVGGPVLFHPPPNCRIREVHCGSQVRLVVIAIRDIAKGEEITVDYSLGDWGDNAMEDEAGPHPLSLSVSDYLTPSWSLSPSSSPLTHSEASDSDREEDEEEEDDDDDDDDEEEIEDMRGRMLRRRKKRKLPMSAVNSKKKGSPTASHRGPGRPCSSFSRPVAPEVRAQVQPPLSAALASPTTNINNNININISSSSSTVLNHRQHCPYCGRNFRSLARHLEKYHSNQPDVRTAMEMAHLHNHSNGSAAHNHSSVSAAGASQNHSFAVPQPSSAPSLFSRESPAGRSNQVSFSLSTPPTAQPPNKKGQSLTTGTAKHATPPAVQRVKSPSPPVSSHKRGRKMKRETQASPQKPEVDSLGTQDELVPPPTPEPDVDPEENLDLSAGEEEAPALKNGETMCSAKPHTSPILSSLSCLVQYLRHQQYSSFQSLTRSPHSAEAWRLLCHSSLSLLILFNRHRDCEVAKLTIQDYHSRSVPHGNSPTSSASGMEALLSPFERHVLCHLPRAGVLGKRGRVQPLILPPHSESCLDLLLQTSPNVGVDPLSPYVFSRPYHSPATPLRGTDLLRNLARASGAKNPGPLTATRARRQVAILTQLLLLDEGEGPAEAIKRLEDFLDLQYQVTQNCASIIQDPSLMGRVGRVVLYGEKQGVLFRGMSLQQICLELDVMSGNSAESFSDESEAELVKEEVKKVKKVKKAKVVKVKVEIPVKKKGRGRPPKKKKLPASGPVAPTTPKDPKKKATPQKTGKRGVLKRPWSEAERLAVETNLKQNLIEHRVPAKADCERCLQLCPMLVGNHRDWRAIKFYVHNRIQLLKKQDRRLSAAAAAIL